MLLKDDDVIRIYERLHNDYPVELTSAYKQGFNSTVDFPILIGMSTSGKFEMFCDDVPSFAFYAMGNDGEVLRHLHLETATEAEKTIAEFMGGKLTLI